MLEIESCYANGDLARALKQAAEFIEAIGWSAVQHVVTYRDETIADAWWVDVIYYPSRAQKMTSPVAWSQDENRH